jgi:hypothetical protein
MKQFVLTYSSWNRINEGDGENLEKVTADLTRLAQLGLISQSELKDELRSIKREMRATNAIEEDPIYKIILQSPEYQEFKELGLQVVSSRTQIKNGTLVIGQPGYSSSNQFALGFYSGTQVLKRLAPKRLDMDIRWRRVGSMDFRIKDFSNKLAPNTSDAEFYLTAMRWALDNIDFKATSRYSSTPHFPVKGRSSSF